MRPEVGITYSSPRFGRYITILELDDYDGETYTFDVEFVDKDTLERENGPVRGLQVSQVDFQKWTEVKI